MQSSLAVGGSHRQPLADIFLSGVACGHWVLVAYVCGMCHPPPSVAFVVSTGCEEWLVFAEVSTGCEHSLHRV
jgi:hypothetical protein